jgi:hypothetical protein
MIPSNINTQARTYIFELKNCAGEFGFKANSWKLNFATDVEKKSIEKEFHPTLALKVSSDTSAEVFDMVSSALIHPDTPAAANPAFLKNEESCFLIAFHPEKKR